MRRLGTVSGAAAGVVVVRAPPHEPGAEPPAPGTEAVDEDLSLVGTVVDVFGPTSRPYLAISPSQSVDPAAIHGARLYAR